MKRVIELGYSTHGYWADSKEIYKLEKERENIIDDILLKDNQEAIWITQKPEDAVVYNRSGQDHDLPIEKKEIKLLEKVDLSNATHIKSMDDPDGGELWIRSIN